MTCIFFFYDCCAFSFFFFFSSRRRHTRSLRDWSSDVCSSDLTLLGLEQAFAAEQRVALLGGEAQRVQHARARAARIVGGDLERGAGAVGEREADARDAAREHVGIGADPGLALDAELADHGRALLRAEADLAQEDVGALRARLGEEPRHER